jgi:UDP-N-acetylmuramate dehydrogenase
MPISHISHISHISQHFTNAGLNVSENVSLAEYSTMRVGGTASALVHATTQEELAKAIQVAQAQNIPMYFLGSGSNTLFVDDFDGVLIKIETKGIITLEDGGESTLFSVAAGEDWHEFVEFCVDQNLVGNENLAYIPGTVGAAPVQNIAAYGQVQEDTMVSVTAIEIETGETKTFSKAECDFSYRGSIFKGKLRGKYCIASVQYRLQKATNYTPELSYHSRYESLRDFLPKTNEPITPKDIFRAIVALRKHKLPQVEESGTLGSFFMNPFISKDHLLELQQTFPDIQFYPVDKMQYPTTSDPELQNAELVKIPAGWLLEELGFRGKFQGNVGTSPKQALCIVVTGPATGEEVLAFAQKIRNTVLQKTNISLQTEVNIIDKTGPREL